MELHLQLDNKRSKFDGREPFCLQKPRTSHHGALITTSYITVTLAWNHFLLSKHSVKAGKIVLTLEEYFSIIVCKVPCARHQSILGPAPGPSPRSRCSQSAAALDMVPTNILILHTLLLAACWGKLVICQSGFSAKCLEVYLLVKYSQIELLFTE